jgi:hypothetical protein
MSLGNNAVRATDLDHYVNNEFIVVWILDQDVGSYDRGIYVRHIQIDTQNNDIVLLGTNTRLDINFGDNDAFNNPSIACFPSGHYVVTWWHEDKGTEVKSIQGQIFNANDNPLIDSGPFMINIDSTPYAPESRVPYAKVEAILSNNNPDYDRFVVTWPGEESGSRDIYYRVLEYQY